MEAKKQEGQIPFDQARLLLLSMAAVKEGDKERVEKIRIEAEALGIKMGPGNNAA